MTRTHGFSALILLVIAWASTGSTLAQGQSLKAYCATVGNDDRTSPLTTALAPEGQRIPDLRTDSIENIKRNIVYRCMSGAVWICNFGANLLCAKADVRRARPEVNAY